MDKTKKFSPSEILSSASLPEDFLATIPDFTKPEAIKIIIDTLKEVYNSKMPFNVYLGIKVTELSLERAIIEIESREELYGNYVQKILHGGVISAVIDLSGGIIAQTHAIHSMKGVSIAELISRFSKMSTLNMRVDYLRPGSGKIFKCISHVIRAGNKIAVTRMDMFNDSDILIATGTGTYLIG
ncbi:MAG TPA: thioesterase family protein [Spirochaetota bacterium]|nr:thioesterase family protein [Spirochaetota bacterium]HOK92100.1 thioesterase family protein [Spirochaetota bacterium]HPP95145.1 thioesterase family protein [Spirochaetota bacterium]